MFKKGQIIRSKISGRYAVVVEATAGSILCSIRMLTGDSKGKVLRYYPRSDIQSELIGNNYRSTVPALPEQRGCRKEDC